MNLDFDLRDLQAFRAVAELSSFRKAADSLHLSQPALSRRIEKLEQALDVRLLERTTRRVNLTSVGRDFQVKVQHLLDELDYTLLGVRSATAPRIGEITVACIASATHLLTRGIEVHNARHPKVRVKVIDARANDVLSAVMSGEADFGINFTGGQEPDIEFKPLVEDRFIAACRHDHPLAGRRRVAWADLADYDYISLSRTSGNRLLLDLALAGASKAPTSLYETHQFSTMLAMVEAGLGVAALPSLAMPADHPVLVGVTLNEPVVSRQIGLISRRGRRLAPAAVPLFEILQKMRRKRR